jgi:hypothetical protein
MALTAPDVNGALQQRGIAIRQDYADLFSGQRVALRVLQRVPPVYAQLCLRAHRKPVDRTGDHDGIGAAELGVQELHVVFDDAVGIRSLAGIASIARSDVHAV